jgi:hypothetical protein
MYLVKVQDTCRSKILISHLGTKRTALVVVVVNVIVIVVEPIVVIADEIIIIIIVVAAILSCWNVIRLTVQRCISLGTGRGWLMV